MDYNVVLIDKLGQDEAITENEDGTYTIFLDASLDSFKQHEKFIHAMKHIQNLDFNKHDADSVEFDAHSK